MKDDICTVESNQVDYQLHILPLHASYTYSPTMTTLYLVIFHGIVVLTKHVMFEICIYLELRPLDIVVNHFVFVIYGKLCYIL